MKCPFCNKEIYDSASFCGFCGKQIPKTQVKEAVPVPPAQPTQQYQTPMQPHQQASYPQPPPSAQQYQQVPPVQPKPQAQPNHAAQQHQQIPPVQPVQQYQQTRQAVPPTNPPPQAAQPQYAPPADVDASVKQKPKKEKKKAKDKLQKNKTKKKNIGIKVLLVFVLIAFICGGVLGFLNARNIISLKKLFPDDEFKWADPSDGNAETVETEADSDDKGNGKDSTEETTSPDGESGTEPSENSSDDTSESPATTDSASDTDEPPSDTSDSTSDTDTSDTTASDSEQSPDDDSEHYAEFVGNNLVIIDDKAHIWTKSTINGIMATAQAMSEASGYSIMIVITNDTFGQNSKDFADGYFNHAISSREDNTEGLTYDGYLFLINLADYEYYLSTGGAAIDLYTDSVLEELFNEIYQLMADGNYEAAVRKIIEKTIY